jgi:hypothetical protein
MIIDTKLIDLRPPMRVLLHCALLHCRTAASGTRWRRSGRARTSPPYPPSRNSQPPPCSSLESESEEARITFVCTVVFLGFVCIAQPPPDKGLPPFHDNIFCVCSRAHACPAGVCGPSCGPRDLRWPSLVAPSAQCTSCCLEGSRSRHPPLLRHLRQRDPEGASSLRRRKWQQP